MSHKTALRYMIILVAGVMLLVVTVPTLLAGTTTYQSGYPFLTLVGLGVVFRTFVKDYHQQRPTLLLNFIQLGYLVTLVIALYFSITVLIDLF
jgi:hypothetical protein